MQRGSREQTAEGTSQDELAVESGQWSAEGGSEEDGQRWVGIPSGFCRSLAKNTLPAIVYKMHEKLYKKKVSQNYPSCTWSWPKSILFVCSFSPTPSVVFLVAIKKCVIPPVGTHWMNHGPWIVLVLRSSCIWGSRRGVSHWIKTVFI